MDTSHNFHDSIGDVPSELMPRRDALRTGAAVAAGVATLVLPAAAASASVSGGGGGGGSFDFALEPNVAQRGTTTYDGSFNRYYASLAYVNVSGSIQSVWLAQADSPDANFVWSNESDVAWSTTSINGPYNSASLGSPVTVPVEGALWVRVQIVEADERTYVGTLVIGHSTGLPTFEPFPLSHFND